MNIRQFYQKALEAFDLIQNGDWIKAAALILELSQEFLPGAEDTPKPVMAAGVQDSGDDLTDDEVNEFKAKLKEAKKAAEKAPRGSKAAVGGPWAIILVQTLGPILFRKLEEWLKNRK